jgi:NADH-quinone oxidoreductase subunit L
MKVPLLDLAAQNKPLRADILAAMERVMDSQGFILGPEVEKFEAAAARACGAKHALGVSSGTDALVLALMALGVGAGFALYGRKTRTSATARDPLEQALPRVFAALAARLGFDELYAATVGRLNDALATFADLLDRFIFDGLIRLLTRLGQFIGLVNRETDEDLLNGGFDATSEQLKASGKTYSRAQTGDTHGYLLMVALGFVLLVLAVMLGGAR